MRESLPRGYYRELPELASGRSGRLSPGVRARDHADLAHRGPDRPRERRPVRRGVPAGGAALDRRALGHPRDAAPRPDRERPPHGAPHRSAPRRGRARRRLGRGASWPRARRAAASSAQTLDEFVEQPAVAHRRSSSPASCTSSGCPAAPFPPLVWLEHWIAEEALNAEDAVGPLDPAAGAHPDHDGEQHHQPARHRAARLADVRRAAERHGGGAARGSVGALRPDDVRDPRPLSPRGRADRQAHRAARGRGGAPGRRSGPARRATDDARRRGAATSATTWSTKASPSWSGRRAIAPTARRSGPPLGAAPPERRLRRRHRRRAPSARWRLLFWLGRPRGAAGAGSLVLLFALIPANDIAVSAVNQLVTAFLPPRVLAQAGLRPSTACPPSTGPPWSSRRSSAASRRCARRSTISRCSSSPTARRTSTSPC